MSPSTTKSGASTASSSAAESAPESTPTVLSLVRRGWPPLAIFLAAVLWWPAGFWGRDDWLRLPISVPTADVLLLGSLAAAAVTGLLVRSPWPRFAIVAGFPVLAWLTSSPAVTDSRGRAIVITALVVGAIIGTWLGERGARATTATAGTLAVVAGLTPATWPHGALAAVALALPFTVASWQRVAPTVIGLLRVVVTYLVAGLLAAAVDQGWNAIPAAAGGPSFRDQLRAFFTRAWDHLQAHAGDVTTDLLGDVASWLWLTVVVAVVIVVVRVARSRR